MAAVAAIDVRDKMSFVWCAANIDRALTSFDRVAAKLVSSAANVDRG
jgi:hypothetical protein